MNTDNELKILQEQHKKIFSKTLNRLMEKHHKTQDDIVTDLGINKSTISTWCRGIKMPRTNGLQLLADYFNVTISDFLVDNLQTPDISSENVEFPVIGDVAAGFDKVVIEEWSGDKIKVPVEFLKGKSRDNFFVLRVTGDSMYPLYINGDKVLVQKQNTVDYSGQVAVIIYDNELGTIKKFEQKKDCISLVPINPQYQPEKITGADLEKVHIMGIPKLLIREIEEQI